MQNYLEKMDIFSQSYRDTGRIRAASFVNDSTIESRWINEKNDKENHVEYSGQSVTD